MGRRSVRGVGGTRNCDWWFTDEAVLIDTAGRYTTQDRTATVDAERLGRLPRAAAQVAAAPADQRRAADRQHPGPAAADAGRAQGARRRSCARGCRSCSDKLGVRAAGLRAGHQGRPDRRLQRVLRRPRQGGARPGLGLHASPYDADQPRRPARADFGTRVRRARASACATAGRAAMEAERDVLAARRDLRLPAAVRRAAAACSAASSSRSSSGGGALEERPLAARRLLHQRHAGRHADRPRARHARRAPSASSSARRRAAAARGKSFFLHAAAEGRGLRRAGPGRREPAMPRRAARRCCASSASRRCCCSASALARRLGGRATRATRPTSPRSQAQLPDAEDGGRRRCRRRPPPTSRRCRRCSTAVRDAAQPADFPLADAAAAR